jgi:hypothetical protein
MPHSIEPEPGENETECARCGAHFPLDLTRCPNCGVSLYEPEDDEESPRKFGASKPGLGAKLDSLFHRLTHKPYAVDQLFGAAINEAGLFNDLLARVHGDRPAAERLVEYERQQSPRSTRLHCIQKALARLERDSSTSGQE